MMRRRFRPAYALPFLLLLGALSAWIFSRPFTPADPPPAPPAPTELAIDFPIGWIEIPGKISRTYRSPRPGAGLLQLSLHPPLAAGTDAAGAAENLDAMLGEMVSEMEFGQRLETARFDTPAGPLAFAKYRSPRHGVLGFWLLASDPMVFATYVDGGPSTAEKDIADANKAFQTARFD